MPVMPSIGLGVELVVVAVGMLVVVVEVEGSEVVGADVASSATDEVEPPLVELQEVMTRASTDSHSERCDIQQA